MTAFKTAARLGSIAACCLLPATIANGEAITVQFDDGGCDPLVAFDEVHELGTIQFPLMELIEASFVVTSDTACAQAGDDPAIDNQLVSITNVSEFAWRNLHYVGDTSQTSGMRTLISNSDGTVQAGPAFKIDDIGVNRPLVFESATPDLIFEIGETWDFILQDFRSINHPVVDPDALSSVGVVGLDSANFLDSSGSIIGQLVPEPTATTLVAAALLACACRRVLQRRCAC